MNSKGKGNRNERRARDILKGLGYTLVVKSGASLGVFDLVALSVEYNHALLIQVRSNRKPGCAELKILKGFPVPKFCRKELWAFKDYHRNPEIVGL